MFGGLLVERKSHQIANVCSANGISKSTEMVRFEKGLWRVKIHRSQMLTFMKKTIPL